MEDLPKVGRRRRNPRHWVTVGEAGRRMGLSESAIRWNIRQGYLRAAFDGYRWRIDLDDLRTFRDEWYGD